MNRAIILAAGKGTRMNSDLPKVLHKIQSKEMILHVIDSVKASGIDEIWVVVGFNADDVIATLPSDVKYFYQKEQLGTGHAIMCGADHIKGKTGKTVVISGDTPLLKPETITNAINADNDATILTSIVSDSGSYGRIIRLENSFKGIVEFKDANEEQRSIKEVNSGIYVFNNENLFNYIEEIKNNNKQNEYYLTDVLSVFLEKGKTVGTIEVDETEMLGINNKKDLMEGEYIMKHKVLEGHALAGVCIIDKETTYIDGTVKIGSNVTIHQNVILKGNTVIGDNVEILPFTYIVDSIVSANANIGPYARLRAGSNIGEGSKVGNFVEVKNSNIGNKTKIGHLSYIGDATIGAEVNVGAGVVIANYDGENKHNSLVGDRAFIGSNSTLISPVKIGDGAKIAAGSTITDDVNSGRTAFARARQIEK